MSVSASMSVSVSVSVSESVSMSVSVSVSGSWTVYVTRAYVCVYVSMCLSESGPVHKKHTQTQDIHTHIGTPPVGVPMCMCVSRLCVCLWRIHRVWV